MFVKALGQVAQWIELLTTDQKAGGSNPSLLTAILMTSNPFRVGCCCFGGSHRLKSGLMMQSPPTRTGK